MAMVLSLVVAVWLLTALLTWQDARHELDELLDGHLAQAAALLVAQQAQDLGETEHGEHSINAPTLHRYAPLVAFQVFHEGQLTLRSGNAPMLPMAGLGGNFKSGFETVQIEGQAWRIFAAYGAEQDVQVYVGEALQSRASILWAVLRSTLWPMLLALPLLGLAVWWAVRQGIAPLRHLSETLAQRQPQSLHPVTLDGASSEMVPMVQSLNDLLARMGTLLESERRFTADAAHELRTPIAAIRTQAQVALGETDGALRQHALRNTLEGCDRATRLVEQLLTLSRLEAGETLAMAPMDVRSVAQRVAADLAPKALARQQELALDATSACVVNGNETLLGVLVRNLLDNAIHYSPHYATVRLQLRTDAQGVLLQVEDSGPGLSEADLARLGKRFFRVLGNAHSGSGLGWSIVQRIAAVHGWNLHAARSPSLGGLCITLHMPLWSST